MEERKRVIRAFVEILTIDGISGSGELRTKRIPDTLGIRDSFKVVAGIRSEVRPREQAQGIEVIPLKFEYSAPRQIQKVGCPTPRLIAAENPT